VDARRLRDQPDANSSRYRERPDVLLHEGELERGEKGLVLREPEHWMYSRCREKPELLLHEGELERGEKGLVLRQPEHWMYTRVWRDQRRPRSLEGPRSH